MDKQHEPDADFEWLMLPRGAEELDASSRAADYPPETEAGLQRESRARPQIRHQQGAG